MNRLDKLKRREEVLANRLERARSKAAIYQNLADFWQAKAELLEAEYEECYDALNVASQVKGVMPTPNTTPGYLRFGADHMRRWSPAGRGTWVDCGGYARKCIHG